MTYLYEVLDNLYLTSFTGAQKHCPGREDVFVVNCTKDLPMVNQNNIRVAVHDDMNKNEIDSMFLALPQVVQKIDDQLASGKIVVVHCLAGQQRSPTVVCAYLMHKLGWRLVDAVQHIREKKKDAFFWQVNFRDALERYEMVLSRNK